MKYLLDTCALIWLVNRSAQLSPAARNAIGEYGSVCYVSAFTAWEMALLLTRGKLKLLKPLSQWWGKALEIHSLTELHINATIAIVSVNLQPIHNDPADRVLIATAQEHRLTLLTPDPLIAKYPDVKILW